MTGVEAEVRPTDPLSILSLAAGIAAMVLALASVLPLVGLCLGPLSALAALLALVSGLASVARTFLDKTLEGRPQALTGLGLALLWGLAAALLARFVAHH